MRLSFDDEESFTEVVGSLCFNNPPSDDPDALQPEPERNNSSMELQERNEDICFNNTPNILQQIGSSGIHVQLQARERIENTTV